MSVRHTYCSNENCKYIMENFESLTRDFKGILLRNM